MTIQQKPISQTSLFLSYARTDDELFVKRLYEDLKAHGLRVWWDRVSMPSRALTFLQEIRDAITAVDQLVLVIGPGAVQSDYVRAEWEYALGICKPVIPVLRIGKGNNDSPEDYGQIPPRLITYHCLDFRPTRPYSRAFTELLDKLRDPILPLGTLVAVPSLPPHFLWRADDIKSLTQKIVPDINAPVVITSTKMATDVELPSQTTTLQGMGGIGKSVLAAAFAQLCETRRAFPDGVIWLTIGQTPDLFAKLRQLGQTLGDDLKVYASLEGAKTQLAKTLEGKICLIVLDDVWLVSHAESFVNILGPHSRCRLMITTRDAELASVLGAQEHCVEVLSDTSALQMLADWSNQHDLPQQAKAVAKECGNLPFALALCGAMVREGTSWQDVLEALREADLEFLEKDLLNYPYKNVVRSVKASIDMLEKNQATLYKYLAIFPADTSVSEAAIMTLWLYTNGLNPRNARRLLTVLGNRALLRLDGEAPNRQVILHDLQHDYLIADQRLQLRDLHNKLIKAYNIEHWADIPLDEPYLWDHLAYHLVEAGRGDELVVTVKDLRYLAHKIYARSAFAAQSDLAAAEQYAQDDATIGLLKRQFALVLHWLNRCRGINDITATLHCRLSHLSLLIDACRNLEANIPRPAIIGWHPLPDVPDSALIRTLEGHKDVVTRVAISPDGRWIVSASYDKTLKIWDAESGAELRTLLATDGLSTVAISLDGQSIVSGSFGKLSIWDIQTGVESLTYDVAGSVCDVAVCPDGRWFVCAMYIGTLDIWDMMMGQGRGRSLGSHTGPVNSVAVSPDGQWIVSAGGSVPLDQWWDLLSENIRYPWDIRPEDKTLKIWNAVSGELCRTLEGHRSDVNCVTVTPDGQRIISGSEDGTLIVWDAATGSQIHTLDGHRGAVTSVAISPNGRWIVSAAGTTLTMWDVETGAELRTLGNHMGLITSVAVSPDGSWTISASKDRTLKVWSTETSVEQPALTKPEGAVKAVAVSSDGHWAVSAYSNRDTTLIVWDAVTGSQIHTLDGHRRAVTSVAISPNGRWIVSAAGTTLTMWDVETGAELRTLAGHKDHVGSVAISPNGRWIVSASKDALKIWNAKTGTELRTLRATPWSDPLSMIPHEPRTHTEDVNSMAVSPDGNWIVTAAGNRNKNTQIWGLWTDATVKIWDAKTGYRGYISSYPGVCYTETTLGVAVSPDGRWGVSALESGVLEVWDAATKSSLRYLRGHSRPVCGVAVNPNGLSVASVSEDGTLRIWDPQTSTCLATFYAYGRLECCSWFPDGKHLIVGGIYGLYWLQLIQ